MTLGGKLIELRTEKNMSQRAVERAVGFSAGALSNYERNKYVPTTEKLTKLAEYYNFDLLNFDEGPDGRNGSGAPDPTAFLATGGPSKCTNPEVGEYWLHRNKDGTCFSALVVSKTAYKATCLRVLSNEKHDKWDVTFVPFGTKIKHIDCSNVSTLYLKNLEKRLGSIDDTILSKVTTKLSEYLGLKPIVKEVIKEVPVEKEVTKEVPVEKDTQGTEYLVRYIIADTKAKTYEDIFNKLFGE